ncbi:MAG TPA: hypothetical protein VMF69_25825 [Gemmataceae bacterium]|nr:hypothetical protein [Gemmataceae bacterium]
MREYLCRPYPKRPLRHLLAVEQQYQTIPPDVGHIQHQVVKKELTGQQRIAVLEGTGRGPTPDGFFRRIVQAQLRLADAESAGEDGSFRFTISAISDPPSSNK